MFPLDTKVPYETPGYEHYKIKKKMGLGLRRYLRTDFPCRKIGVYVGMERDNFRCYIAGQLRNGMSMDDFGKGWVLDHIVPLFLFDHASKQDLLVAWNYANLIPLPPMLNRLKGVSVEFSNEELSKRLKFFPTNQALPLLIQRMNSFSEMMKALVSDDKQLENAAQWA